MKIAINVIATNKYIEFVRPLCQSIERFFYPNALRTIVLHTDQDILSDLSILCPKLRFHINIIQHQKWPYITLMRFHMFLQTQHVLLDHDQCFYIDADAIFINTIDTNLPTGMYACVHPGFKGGSGTPETNPTSTAYIPKLMAGGITYFYGGFFGGTSHDFIGLCQKLKIAVDIDGQNNIMAIWHDESHLNKYFVYYPPAFVFQYPFAVAELFGNPTFDTVILFLDKNARGGLDSYRLEK